MDSPAPGPALWRAERDGNAAFLFGTIHVAAPDAAWRTPLLDRLIAEADLVLLERGQFAKSRPDIFLATLWAQFRPSISLLEALPEEERPKLAQLCRELKVNPLRVGMLSPVVAGSILSTLVAERAGRTQEHSVDAAIYRDSKGRCQPIEPSGVWSRVFSREVQIAMAENPRLMTLDDVGTQIAKLERLDAAYMAGDLAVIAEQQLVGSGPFFDAFLNRRNVAWVDKIARSTQRGTRVLAAGGLAHFVGPSGVCAQLAAEGFEVTLVQGIPAEGVWPV